jgi:hypothetical protein
MGHPEQKQIQDRGETAATRREKLAATNGEGTRAQARPLHEQRKRAPGRAGAAARGRAALERAGGRKNQKQIPLSARDDTRRSGEKFPATVPVFKSSHDPSTTLGMTAAERLGKSAQP